MCFPPLVGSSWGCSFSAGDIVAETRRWSLIWSLARTGSSSLQLGLSTHDGFHSSMRADPANRLLMGQTPPPFDCATQSVTYANSSFSTPIQCCSTFFSFIVFFFQRVWTLTTKLWILALKQQENVENVWRGPTDTWYSCFYVFTLGQGKLPLCKRRFKRKTFSLWNVKTSTIETTLELIWSLWLLLWVLTEIGLNSNIYSEFFFFFFVEM